MTPTERVLARLPAPRVVTGAVRAVKANRLEPGMAFRTEPVLLGQFPLEKVNLRALGSERGKPIRCQSRLAGDMQLRAGIVGQDGIDFHARRRVGACFRRMRRYAARP